MLFARVDFVPTINLERESSFFRSLIKAKLTLMKAGLIPEKKTREESEAVVDLILIWPKKPKSWGRCRYFDVKEEWMMSGSLCSEYFLQC